MPRGRAQTKTEVLTLRVLPSVKAAAKLAAERDHRSVTSLIEVLILNHCKATGIHLDVPAPEEAASK